MNADAPFHAALVVNSRIAFSRQPLQCQSAFDGANHRAELDKDPVAGRFDDPPTMLGDKRVGDTVVLA